VNTDHTKGRSPVGPRPIPASVASCGASRQREKFLPRLCASVGCALRTGWVGCASAIEVLRLGAGVVSVALTLGGFGGADPALVVARPLKRRTRNRALILGAVIRKRGGKSGRRHERRHKGAAKINVVMRLSTIFPFPG